MPSIQLKAISLATPDGRDLLQNLDLSFGTERTGIVGRNGTGKTTLLRAIAGEIAPKSDFLLLDEPTNNLDAEGRTAVAELLRGWKGGALVVSHDRDLLRNVDRILELTSLRAKLYGGNWDAYEQRQALDLAAAEHDLSV